MMKDKIIFLDIDGVLNGYNLINISLFKILHKVIKPINYNLYKKLRHKYDIFGIHESKVRYLAKIVRKTNAKIVMSSSWRHIFFNRAYDDMTNNSKKLLDLFKKYKIELIDKTPRLENRGLEILSWLEQHEVENYVVFDDEKSLLRDLIDPDHVIITSSVKKPGKIIHGHWSENTGLKRRHIRKAVRILNGGHK